MFFLESLFIFIFGIIVGSFLNVLILRYNTGLSFAKGRSKCFSCSKTLSSMELIPLFSFLFLKGRCLSCKSKISIQYPLIEFITGVVFVFVFWKLGISFLTILYLFVFSLLIVIFVYDLKHKIIPDALVWIFNVISLLILFDRLGFNNILNQSNHLELLSGPILFSFFAFFWVISSGKWMGFGDAKLALGVGWLLGFSGGVLAILLAFWTGAIWSLFAMGFNKLNIFKNKLTIKSEIPFAPFIILGLLIVFATGWNLTNLFYLLG